MNTRLRVADAGDLFDPVAADAPRTIVDDAQGGIRYWPDVVDPATAWAWFEALRDGASWYTMRRPMYDRIVDVPRLVGAYALDALPDALPLHAMLECVARIVPAPYTSVGLNLYRDGRDSVAMHGDKLHSLRDGHPIALVSLGAPRRMFIRARTGTRATTAVELEPGSLLCMSHAAQITHEHGIPKTARTVGPRMSVVFRVRPPQASPYGGMRPRDAIARRAEPTDG